MRIKRKRPNILHASCCTFVLLRGRMAPARKFSASIEARCALSFLGETDRQCATKKSHLSGVPLRWGSLRCKSKFWARNFKFWARDVHPTTSQAQVKTCWARKTNSRSSHPRSNEIHRVFHYAGDHYGANQNWGAKFQILGQRCTPHYFSGPRCAPHCFSGPSQNPLGAKNQFA